MNTQSLSAKGVARLITCLAMLLALLGPLARPPQAAAHVNAAFVVNSTGDSVSGGAADGVCDVGGGVCTLREAIKEGNVASGTTSITFGLISATINLTLGALSITGNNININGTNLGNIAISGASNPADTDIFNIQGNYNTLGNLLVRDSKRDGIYINDTPNAGNGNQNTINNVAVIGSARSGIYIHGSTVPGGGDDNFIQSSLIGIATWGATACVDSARNGQDGIVIDAGADGTLINASRIVCNGYSGIYNDGHLGEISFTNIATTQIGTDGNHYLGNGHSGIVDYQGSVTTLHGNTISGNGNHGIWLQGSHDSIVYNNKVGTNSDATIALPNTYNGILISDGAHANAIGSPTAVTQRNIISGNSADGVLLNSGATNNVLDGNYIGLGGNGTTVIPNGYAGVAFMEASSNTLSTSDATVIQYIAGNSREGVYVENSDGIIINSSTYIGVAANGSAAGNNLEGVRLDDWYGPTTNAIIRPDKVMYNGWTGIAVEGDTYSSTGNQLTPKEVGSNVGLPIDLGNDGHTANGTPHTIPPSPNNWMEYPTIDSTSGREINGVTCPGCTVYIYSATGDPTAGGGGGVLLTSVTANGITGDFEYTIPVIVPAITMVACSTGNDCSEMSPKYEIGINAVLLPILMR